MSKGIKHFNLDRFVYRGMTTLGKLICPDGSVFYTLEDCVRGWGIKDKGNTAIGHTEGKDGYLMTVTMSTRFEREMVSIHTESDLYTLKANGCEFKGIRMHGANTIEDVEGCIGVAKNKVSDTRIQGTMEAAVTALVKKYTAEGYECRLNVRNLPQAA